MRESAQYKKDPANQLRPGIGDGLTSDWSRRRCRAACNLPSGAPRLNRMTLGRQELFS